MEFNSLLCLLLVPSLSFSAQLCANNATKGADGCGRFLECIDGHWVSRTCSKGLTYSPKQQSCVFGQKCRGKRQTTGYYHTKTFNHFQHAGHMNHFQKFEIQPNFQSRPPSIRMRNGVTSSRKAYKSESRTMNGVTETTVWYYNSNGPNFKFLMPGHLPPVSNPIDWIEKNYQKYPVVQVPYEGDVPEQPQLPTQTWPNYPTHVETERPFYPPPRETERPFYPPPRETERPFYPPPRKTERPFYPPNQTYPPYIPPPATEKPTIATTTSTEIPRTQQKWNTILPTECGFSGRFLERRVQEKIVAGVPDNIENNPWQVAIVETSTKKLRCGGSIISRNHVLTAAHCFWKETSHFATNGKVTSKQQIVQKQDRLVQSGSNDINEPSASYKIIELYLNEKYNTAHRRNDIALILIGGDFVWSTRVYPICLPARDATYWVHRECRVSGWGQKTSESTSTETMLRSAVIQIGEPKTCSTSYQGHVNISKGMFCATGFDANKTRVDTCQGDSGGPCACDEDNRGTLFGITSFGIGCARDEYPGVYVKVALYLSWIRERLEMSVGSRSRSSLTSTEDVGDPALVDPEDDPDADIL